MKRHIGIIFPSTKGGGVHQFVLSIADSLINYSDAFEYSIIHYKGEKPNQFFDSSRTEPRYLAIPQPSYSLVRKTLHFLGLVTGIEGFLIQHLDKTLRGKGIDLLVIPTPFSFDIPLSVPYVVSLPDYMHKYYPRSPEYGWKVRTARDIIYPYYAQNSLLTVADSNQGADDIHTFARMPMAKLRVVKYIPPSYVYKYRDMTREEVETTLAHFKLPERFLFYPAQFWLQKNHDRIIRALHKIKQERGVTISLVLVGNSKGNYAPCFEAVMKLAEKLGVRVDVHHLGYVEHKEVVALYKQAVALVSPAFQGPTTLPPLEAMVLGCPVVTANIFEVPKQVGDAALLFNPSDIDDIAEKVYKVWTDENLRKEMVKRGYTQTRDLTLEHYGKEWLSVIEEALRHHDPR